MRVLARNVTGNAASGRNCDRRVTVFSVADLATACVCSTCNVGSRVCSVHAPMLNLRGPARALRLLHAVRCRQEQPNGRSERGKIGIAFS